MSLVFDGNQWLAMTSRADLGQVRSRHRILDSVSLELPESLRGVVDSENFAAQVELYSLMFFMGLRLPLCHPVCDVLEFLGFVPSQLVPNAWRILMACCIAW